MTNKSQGDLNFRKFPLIGIFLALLFMFFLEASISPITSRDLEIKCFENQTAQFSTADSHKNPTNDLDHFMEQIEEKEEERQEDTLLEYSLDAIWSPYFDDWFVYSLFPKTLKSPNYRINIRVPLYILFQNLKLDLV
ncbi:hypothetical protein [Aquiflexum sp.]|uniref:hypothetical protein n=1 Tax=Aquiflexum sp. TaxID=1872584 RepID=UPI003594604B